MSAPLVVNTTDGTVWTRRGALRGGEPLYAPAGVCGCPEFVMATLAELAEHGISGSADVLPVPVGPQPWSQAEAKDEFERILREKFRLEDALTKSRRDAARARRERDLIRERVSEPYGCTHCGHTKRSHGRQYLSGVGMHAWERPTDEQVKDRMLARRAARMPMDVEELRARVAELEAAAYVAPSPSCTRCYGADAARFVAKGGPTTPCRVCGPSQVEQLEARVAELEAERHTTNEALDDAVQALRERQVEREALVERMRAGQRWQRGRNPELVSENLISQSELREIFGIPLMSPWDDEDPLTQTFAPTQVLREVPDGEHAAIVRHDYRVGRDLPETGGAR